MRNHREGHATPALHKAGKRRTLPEKEVDGFGYIMRLDVERAPPELKVETLAKLQSSMVMYAPREHIAPPFFPLKQSAKVEAEMRLTALSNIFKKPPSDSEFTHPCTLESCMEKKDPSPEICTTGLSWGLEWAHLI